MTLIGRQLGRATIYTPQTNVLRFLLTAGSGGSVKAVFGLCGTLLVMIVLSGFASADAIFMTGNHPQPGEENILFENDQTGSTVMGITNQGGAKINFSSTTDTLVTTASGQAKVTASDGLINDITISLASGGTFHDFILNPFKPGADQSLMVTVHLTDGMNPTFTYGSKNGNNFLTILTTNNEAITSITIDSTAGFQDLQQPRVSGVVTPEPGSMLLLGSGILALGTVVRRRLLS